MFRAGSIPGEIGKSHTKKKRRGEYGEGLKGGQK